MEGRNWGLKGHRARLATCPIYRHDCGFDYNLVVAIIEVEHHLPRGGGRRHLVLLGHLKQPPSAVCRFEWEGRILVPNAVLEDVWERTNRRSDVRSYHGRDCTRVPGRALAAPRL